MADRPGFTFGSEPSPEVSVYLREKGDRPAFRWSEVWGQEHAHAFTVAKAVQADVLGTIRESLQWAIDKGVPYETWSRELKPELQRLGWWGEVAMADPATGEVKDRELGSPRRLRTIYDANLRSARAAGQWERGQRTKAVLPFWLYGLGPSVNHRPEHAAMEGVVRPVDDPLWDAWFCPNGWGCKCWLRQITKAEAERRGITAPFEVQTKTYRRVRDDGSFERVQVPVGIDPGWHTNPGLNRSRTLMTNLTDRLASAGEPAARALMSDFWAGSMPEALAAQPAARAPNAKARRSLAPVAVMTEATRAALGASHPVAMVGSDYVAKIVDGHRRGARPTRPADFARVQAILDGGELVERRDRRGTYVMRMDDGLWTLTVNVTRQGEVVVLSLFAIDSDREGRLRQRGKE